MCSEKEKQFRNKLRILNEEFVDFISSAFKDNASYDFSPSLLDYLKHVKEMDKQYAEQPTERKIAIAKRRTTTSAIKSAAKLKEVATVPEPKKLSNGLVEPTGQFAFAPKIQMPAIPSAISTPTFSAPKSAEQSSTPLSQQRKRRQEPLDYDDMRNKSSDDYGKSEKESNFVEKKSTPPNPASSLFSGLPNPASSLFSGPPNPASSLFTNVPQLPASSLFSGPSNPASSLFTNLPQLPAAGLFKFGEESASTKSSFGETLTSGGSLQSSFNKPSLSDYEKSDKESNSAEKKGAPSNPASSLFTNSPASASTKSLFGDMLTSGGSLQSSFNKPAVSDSNAVKASPPSLFATTTSAPTKSLFGDMLKSGGPLQFSFNKPAVSDSNAVKSSPFSPFGNQSSVIPLSSEAATNGESKNEEEGEAEENAPPPKLEEVKHDEPGAVFSTKCSLFNFVGNEYKKVGVGYLHLKKTEAGTQLLIRAATSLGTLWVNTLLDNNFKAEKKAKDKIQFSYPSNEGARTHLVRVVDFEDAIAYLTGEKKP